MVVAFAGVFWRAGFPGTAVAILLGFHCILRTGEMLGLRYGMIRLGRDFRGVVALGETKSRRIEAVSMDDPNIGRLVAALLLKHGRGDSFVEMSEGQFRFAFRGSFGRVP